MKKQLFYALAVLFSAGIMASCSNSGEQTQCENGGECEHCAKHAETAAEEIEKDLQDGTPVEVDVENAQVTTEPDGVQQVQTEVQLTPEQAQ